MWLVQYLPRHHTGRILSQILENVNDGVDPRAYRYSPVGNFHVSSQFSGRLTLTSRNPQESVSVTKPVTLGRSKTGGYYRPRLRTRPRNMTDNTNIPPSLRNDLDRPLLTDKTLLS